MKLQSIVRRIGGKLIDVAEAIEARRSGFDHHAYRDCFATSRAILRLHKPVNVYDVGANNGHWSMILASLAGSVRHVAFFEPQPQFKDALAGISIPDARTSYFPVALGERRSEGTIHGNTASASLLVPDDAQRLHFPGSVVDVEQKVIVETLDSFGNENGLPAPDLLKIDVQGTELAVLRGATQLLRHVRLVVVELSFRSLYRGQSSCWEIQKFLEEQEFILVDWGYAWRMPEAPHELLQADGIFMRRSPVPTSTP